MNGMIRVGLREQLTGWLARRLADLITSEQKTMLATVNDDDDDDDQTGHTMLADLACLLAGSLLRLLVAAAKTISPI